MTPALLSARAKSAIRGGFDLLTQTVQEVIPEDTTGREAVMGQLRATYELAMLAAASLAEPPDES